MQCTGRPPSLQVLRLLHIQRKRCVVLCPPAHYETGWRGGRRSSSRAVGPADPSGDGEQTAKRGRGRPRKLEPPAVDGGDAHGVDGPGPVVKRSRGRPPRDVSAAPARDASPSARPLQVRTPPPADSTGDSDSVSVMRRRGRPPRAESHLAAAAGGGGPSGSGVGNGNGNDEHSRSSSQRAVGRGRPRREGQQQQQEVMAAAAAEAEAEVVAPAAARRGRPPLLKASREVELQVMLRRELRLKPTELRPPPASWKQMRDGAAPETLRARVVALREALGLEVVRRMVQRCPHLLHWHEATLLSKLDDLTLGLGLSRQELLGAVLAYPRLLQSAPDTVLARVALLQAELRLPLKLATTMVAAQPPLVCMAPSTLRMRADLLHEAASLLPQWRRELSDMAPGTLGRMLRCSEAVLNRLVYTYLRVSTNGRKFHEIRSMKTITTIPAAQWRDKNPLYQEWLDNGARDRASGALVRWDGWWRGPHAHVQGQGKDQAGGGATLPLPPGDGGGPADWWGMPSGGLRWSRAAAQLAQPHTHLHPQPGPQAEEPKLGPASSSGRNGGLGSSPSMGSSGWPGGSYDAPPGSLGARGSSGVSGLAFGEGGLHLGNSELWQRYSDLGGGGDGKRWTPPDSDPSGLGGTAARADGSDSDDSDEDMGPEAGGRSERRA